MVSQQKRGILYTRATKSLMFDPAAAIARASLLPRKNQARHPATTPAGGAFGPARPGCSSRPRAGLHGANRTGRPFTGDHAGILLYKTSTVRDLQVTRAPPTRTTASGSGAAA